MRITSCRSRSESRYDKCYSLTHKNVHHKFGMVKAYREYVIIRIWRNISASAMLTRVNISQYRTINYNCLCVYNKNVIYQIFKTFSKQNTDVSRKISPFFKLYIMYIVVYCCYSFLSQLLIYWK